MTIQLTPSLQTLVGSIATASAPIPAKATAGEAKQTIGSSDWHAPSVDSAEIAKAQQTVLGRLGLTDPAQLATQTQADCMKAASGNPLEAMALWSLVLATQIYSPAQEPEGKCGGTTKCVLPPRTEPLPALTVDAIMGNYEAPVPPPDPLILTFHNVERTTPDNPTKIFLINRSKLADAEPIELPANLVKAKDGAYSLTLGDEWTTANDIHAGNVLELYQTKGKRRSPSTVVAINSKGEGLQNAPSLPPGDVIGSISAQAMFRRTHDPVPARLRPEAFVSWLDSGDFTLTSSSAFAAEPKAKIQIENLRTGAVSDGTVNDDGSFKLTLGKVGLHDPILVRLVDHSHAFGDALFERRLTLAAGRDKTPMLAQNPALFADGPATLVPGRLALSGCDEIAGDRAVTPGSIVTLYRAGHPKEKTVAIADREGSFRARLPFDPHADDVLVVEGKSPFALRDSPTDWQKRSAFSVELELESDGALTLATKSGAVRAGSDPVASIQNKDAVSSGAPVRSIRAAIDACSMSFSTYDWRTGNYASLRARSDWSESTVAVFNWDAKKGEVVVTVGAEKGGGWREPELGESKAARSYFQAVGLGSWTDQNNVATVFRQEIGKRGKGGTMPVRFETPEGKVFANGQLKIDSKILEHNTGASQKHHPVWFAELEAGVTQCGS